jgi:hypothetical protein
VSERRSREPPRTYVLRGKYIPQLMSSLGGVVTTSGSRLACRNTLTRDASTRGKDALSPQLQSSICSSLQSTCRYIDPIDRPTRSSASRSWVLSSPYEFRAPLFPREILQLGICKSEEGTTHGFPQGSLQLGICKPILASDRLPSMLTLTLLPKGNFPACHMRVSSSSSSPSSSSLSSSSSPIQVTVSPVRCSFTV